MKLPYEGKNKKQLFQNLRLGIVKKVNTEIKEDDILAGKHAYGTMDINWVEDSSTMSQRVPIMFPMAGDGWGIYSYPEVGDIVVGSFKVGGIPVAIGYIRKSSIHQLGQIKENEVFLNAFNEQVPTDVNDNGVESSDANIRKNTFIPLRPLVSGEIFIRSKALSEMYMDRNGSFRLIARAKRTDSTSKAFTSRLVEIILGKSYGDNLKTAIRDKFGMFYNFFLKHIKGGSLGINERGDLSIDVKGVDSDNEASLDLTVQKELLFTCGKSIISVTKEGLISFKNESGQEISLDNAGKKVTIKDQSGNSIVMNGTTINLGSSANSFSVVGNLLITVLNTMFTMIKNHTHLSSIPGNSTTPSVQLMVGLTEITESQILSKKVRLE